jgi:hypothetical protein
MAAVEAKPAAKRRVIPVHPLLFAAFPVLALYVRNMDQVPVRQILAPLGIAVAGTAVAWAVLALVFRSARKSAVAASVLATVFLSYGRLAPLISPRVWWLVALLAIAAVVVTLVALWRTRKPLYDATSVLNVAATFLIASSCWSIGAGYWRASRPGSHSGERLPLATETDAGRRRAESHRVHGPLTTKSAQLPDIYYIILDAYGRADSLKRYYGYDNTPFVRALEKRGFYVAPRSRANYDETPLCLASSLNFTYLDDVAKRVGASGSLEACREMLDDNAVAAHLSSLGYHYVYIGSGIGQAQVETADLELNVMPDIPAFADEAMRMSGIGTASTIYHHEYDLHRKRLLGVFDGLHAAARLPYHKFVFAHLLAPHPPFVLGANGEAEYPRGPLSFADASWLLQEITRAEYVSHYIAQLEYVNRRTLVALDDILAQPGRRPIIIVQGDHGSRMNLDWSSLERTDVREPFAILNAYYVPRRVRADLYDTISPVNTFRIVLDDVFGAKYPLLPDRSYYSTSDQPYGFTDVTARTSMARDRADSAPKRAAEGPAAHGAH